ncbi:hypothetical protein [uncultured Desulfuromusa sp.]|uniref:hypothetical protein n=1 Tax=uncultured Desulfuromusa sp. TaxID=219183 RepID=UPI002AA62F83|nr:hypothetical protein [uncultured Desulfuromusa sp.]
MPRSGPAPETVTAVSLAKLLNRFERKSNLEDEPARTDLHLSMDNFRFFSRSPVLQMANQLIEKLIVNLLLW